MRSLKGLVQSALAWIWWLRLQFKRSRVRRSLARPAHDQNLLILSWAFPPVATVGVHVITTLTRVAVRAGWSVDVVCGPAPDSPSEAGLELLESVPSEVRVWRVSSCFADSHGSRLHPLHGTVPDIDGHFVCAMAMAELALSISEPKQPSFILATGPRFSNFVAARWLADWLDCALILHYRDEWTVRTPDFVHAGDDDRKAEQACLQRADLVLFSSDAKLSCYRSAFPELDNVRFHVVLNGWDPWFREFGKSPRSVVAPCRFSILYAGRWHRSIHSLIHDLLNLFQAQPRWVEKLQFVFVGEQTGDNLGPLMELAASYPMSIKLVPQVPLSEALQMMNQASSLLLINEHIYDGVIPQKTYDCLATDRPILVYGDSGGAASIVSDLGAGLVAKPGDVAGLASALSGFLSQPPDRWNSNRRTKWIASTNRERTLTDALSLIKFTRRPGASP